MGEAQLAEALLESAGIECSLIHDTIVSVLPLQSEMVEVELCVAEQDAARAEEIINARFDRKEFEELTR